MYSDSNEHDIDKVNILRLCLDDYNQQNLIRQELIELDSNQIVHLFIRYRKEYQYIARLHAKTFRPSLLSGARYKIYKSKRLKPEKILKFEVSIGESLNHCLYFSNIPKYKSPIRRYKKQLKRLNRKECCKKAKNDKQNS